MDKLYTDKEIKILGWAVFIPRLIVMFAAIISGCYAIRMGSVMGTIAGIILLLVYLTDVLYLILVLIVDYYNGDVKRRRDYVEEVDEMLGVEQNLFDTSEIFGNKKKDEEP